MKQVLLLLAFLLSLSANSAMAQPQFDPGAAHYLWPTEASSYLTSTFGETRSSHFHAALDIKTWGRRGYKVYATRDGVVERIAIGPKGYGKVIYLKHSDGSYSVYAHLLSFNPEIQQLADSIRFARDYAFEMNRYVGWKNIKVKQGEVIGLSGASGIGPPHLHFELRTPSNKPFNPLLTNLRAKDEIAPVIQGISLEPLTAESAIEGKNAVYTKKAFKIGNGAYSTGTIEASGPLGLGINVYDKSNGVNNVYAVYKISMWVDGKEFFSSKIDSFSYQETHQMFIDRVFPILQKTDEDYQRLYLADGNTMAHYSTSSENGRLNLKPGNHKVTIQAADYFGNSSTVSIDLKIKEQAAGPTYLSGKRNTQQKVSPHSWQWFHNWVTLSGQQFTNITVGAKPDRYIEHANGVAVELTHSQRLFMNIPGFGAVNFYRKEPGSVGIISSANQEAFTVFPKHTFYDTVSVGMAVNKFKEDSISVELLAEAYPVRDSFHFYVERDGLSDAEHLSFYKWDRREKEWSLIPTTFSPSYIIGEAESLGSFVAMKDTVPPRLFNPRLRQRPDGRWVLHIDAVDNLSGIDYRKTKIWVNGIRGIAEFEPEDDRLVYYHPDFEPTPSATIKATAYDEMGNLKTVEFQLKKESYRVIK